MPRLNDLSTMHVCLRSWGALPWCLKKIPSGLAARVAKEVSIPVIGIGAGSDVDGQIIVIQDMLGMNKGFKPKFLRVYADMFEAMGNAVGQYVSDVKDVTFPNANEQY